MTGDWNGVRSRLRLAGYDFKAGYIGEYADNLSGGQRRGDNYAQQFELGVDVDLAKATGFVDGIFNVTVNARQGRSTSADDTGNKLPDQEIYGDGQDFRLGEFSYAHDVAGKLGSVKLGFYAMGNDFAGTPILCSFQNDGFCAHPVSLPTGSGWSDFPLAKWGGRARANLRPDLYFEVGVFEVNPTGSRSTNGFKVSLSGSTGVIVPVELGKTIAIGPKGLPGHYKLGGYYDTSAVAEIADSSKTYTGRYGGYFLADQMVWSFDAGHDRGLVLVADVTTSAAVTTQIPTYFVAAAVAQGPLVERPTDFVALGYVHASVNRHAVQELQAKQTLLDTVSPSLQLGEDVVELSYGAQVTPWFLLHPNLQYIGNPGAFAAKHLPNAMVFGLQTKLVF